MKSVAVDLDDTLCDFMGPMIDYFNFKHNTSYTLNDMTEYEFIDKWPQAQSTIDEFISNQDNVMNLKPIEGAYEKLKELKCNLIVVTARSYELQEVTKRWIDKHFPDLFNDIIFTNQYGKNDYPKPTKAEICETYSIDILIDDRMSNIESCVQKNKNFRGILHYRPWNEKDRNGNYGFQYWSNIMIS